MNALILTEPLKALEPFQFFVFAFENNLCGSFFRGFCIENIHKRFFFGINSGLPQTGLEAARLDGSAFLPGARSVCVPCEPCKERRSSQSW